MSNLGDFIGKTRSAVHFTAKKTGGAIELSKLKMKAMQLRSQIQSTYERIGTLTYEQQKNYSDNSELIDVCIREIDGLFVQLNEINVTIDGIKNGVKCPACFALNDIKSDYCKSCGVNMNRSRSSQKTE